MPLYNGLFFFTIVTILLIPAVLLGVNEIKIKYYGLFVTICVLILVFYDNKLESLFLVGVYILELSISKIFALIREKKKNKLIFYIVILIAILPLVLVKAVNPTFGFVKLLGISYMTFRVVEIIVNIYDGGIKKVKIIDFTYFVLFFPTLSSGPIDRFKRFVTDLDKQLTVDEYVDRAKRGVYRLFMGLAYKYIIGALIYNYWLSKIPKMHSIINGINYMYSYTLYLFFDFAGYSLMAIGLSYILGIKCPDNFNMPFISKDVKEFWSRWHMTLSFWFRDYVYTRFVMAAMRGKWFKNKYTASYVGYILTMGIMGVWHGNQIYYVIYGLYHGVLLILNDLLDRHCTTYKNFKKNKIGIVVNIFLTFNIISFGMLIFSGYLNK